MCGVLTDSPRLLWILPKGNCSATGGSIKPARGREREREDNGELISRWARSSLATAASNRTARLPPTVSRWPSDIWSSPTSNKNERCHLLAATHKNDTNSFLNPSKLGDVAHTHTQRVAHPSILLNSTDFIQFYCIQFGPAPLRIRDSNSEMRGLCGTVGETR